MDVARLTVGVRARAPDRSAGWPRDTGLPAGSFDLAHARSLLITVPDPALVVAEMVRLVRPGGWVVSMEPDVAGRVYYPPGRPSPLNRSL